jgi:Zn-dependent M28 family amino/carboxypeptidase
MLESARILAGAADPPRRSVLFLAVGGEERGLLGSDYFAENPTVDRDAMVANVNFDMPLFLYPLDDVVAFGAEHSTLAAPTAAAARAAGLTLSPDPMPEEVIFVRSDQFSLVRRGVPAVYLMPGFRSRDPAIDGTAIFQDFLRHDYHKPSDERGLPFDDDSALRFVTMNLHLIRAIADEPERPAWNPGDFFGETFGRR